MPTKRTSTIRTAKRRRRPSNTSKRGGRRAGAGARRAQLPADVLARLGHPPRGGEVRAWLGKLLAEILLLEMRGEIAASLAASLRATAGAIARVARGDEDEADDDDGDGPQLEDIGDDDGDDDTYIRLGSPAR